MKPSIFPLKTQLRATIYEVADYMSLSKYKICKNLWIQWTVGFCSYRESKNLKIRILKPRRWKLKFCLYNGQSTRQGTSTENFGMIRYRIEKESVPKVRKHLAKNERKAKIPSLMMYSETKNIRNNELRAIALWAKLKSNARIQIPWIMKESWNRTKFAHAQLSLKSWKHSAIFCYKVWNFHRVAHA